MADDPLLVPASTAYAPHAMVATVDALATQAGIALLRAGGSAVDAAIGANAVLAVTAPNLCGLGGDLFALVHEGGGAPHVVNASGRAGSGADPERLRREGHEVMPFRLDPRSVTVPGCVDGWLALHARFGRLPLAQVLAGAAGYAADGFPASPLLVGAARTLPAPLPPGAEAYAGLERPGQRVRRPATAGALVAIGSEGRDGFYRGAFGEGLIALGQGEFTPADLERPLAEWVEPLHARVWSHDLWTVPPGSQGYLTLASARLAEAAALIGDPDAGTWATALVAAATAAGRRRPDELWEGADGSALLPPVGSRPESRDTTYLCAVDEDGMGVSLIQSNAAGFGSHLFEPATGINLHNRGIGFSLEAGHPAEYGPGRKPPHTLSPALVTRADGSLYAVLGTQGGDGQPQILLQILARLLVSAQSPGRAIASRRWVLTGSGQGFDTWTAPEGPTVVVEEGAPVAWRPALEAAGHRVQAGAAFDHGFGHAHVIVRQPDGMLSGAADPRARIGSASGY
jgi:gamma-glutamyltranspeptidase/glutathione hydrolase